MVKGCCNLLAKLALRGVYCSRAAIRIDAFNCVSPSSEYKRKSEMVITFSFKIDTRWCNTFSSVYCNLSIVEVAIRPDSNGKPENNPRPSGECLFTHK